MDKHRTVLGALFVGLGLAGVIGMAIVLLVFSVGSAAIGLAAAHESDVPALLALLPVSFGLFICFTIAVGAVPSLIAGYGLLLGRNWARAWALVAGVLNLPGIPFGTAVGIYAIWVFVQDDTARVSR